MKKKKVTFLVPATSANAWRIPLKYWRGGGLCNVGPVMDLVCDFSGFGFPAHSFPRALDVACAPRNSARVLLLRNVTLSPLNNDYNSSLRVAVYGVANRDVCISGLGGPRRIRLHCGDCLNEALKGLVLSLPGRHVTITDVCLEHMPSWRNTPEVAPCAHVSFLPEEECCANDPRLPRGVTTSSLAELYDLLGHQLQKGDTVRNAIGWTQTGTVLQRGLVGTVVKPREGEGPLWVSWQTPEQGAYVLSHASLQHLVVKSLHHWQRLEGLSGQEVQERGRGPVGAGGKLACADAVDRLVARGALQGVHEGAGHGVVEVV